MEDPVIEFYQNHYDPIIFTTSTNVIYILITNQYIAEKKKSLSSNVLVR